MIRAITSFVLVLVALLATAEAQQSNHGETAATVEIESDGSISGGRGEKGQRRRMDIFQGLTEPDKWFRELKGKGGKGGSKKGRGFSLSMSMSMSMSMAAPTPTGPPTDPPAPTDPPVSTDPPSNSPTVSMQPSANPTAFVCPQSCDRDNIADLSNTCQNESTTDQCGPANGSCDCNLGQVINNPGNCNGNDGCTCNGVDPRDFTNTFPDAFIDSGACSSGARICIFNTGRILGTACSSGNSCECNSGTINSQSCLTGNSCPSNAGIIGENSCSGNIACANNAAGGEIGNNSCGAPGACTNNQGTIGDDSCNFPNACSDNTGTIGDDVCNMSNACQNNDAVI